MELADELARLAPGEDQSGIVYSDYGRRARIRTMTVRGLVERTEADVNRVREIARRLRMATARRARESGGSDQ